MSIILRQNKGSELTFAEVDGNFQSLFYSGSLSGNVLTFFYPSSSISQSFDLNAIAGGVRVQNNGTTVANNVTNLNFLGSAVSSIISPSQGEVNITLTGGGGGGGGTGIFNSTGEYGGVVFGTTSSIQVTASAYMSSSYTGTGVTANPNNAGSGGNVLKYGAMFSQSIWHYTDNIGYPTSTQWQTNLDGSVFDRYDANTDTAEIMRLVATLLSASAPDIQGNGKVYSAITEDFQNVSGGSAPAGTVPSVINNSVVTYLNGKGFATAGQTLFEGVTATFETNANFSIKYDSVASGTGNGFSSSADPELFNLGAIGVAFNVSGTERREFYDQFAKSSITAQTSSNVIYTKTGPGTSADGLTIGNIDGGTQPDAFQDGKFVDIFDTGLYNGGITLTTQEATGFYQISASIGIQSGSSVYTDANADSAYTKTEERFFLPSAVTGLATNTLAQNFFGYETSTGTGACVSRSLSGAPYLQSAIWNSSGSVTGLFEPLFTETQYISRLADDNSFVATTAGAGGAFRASCVGGTVDIANSIFDSTGASARSTGTTPEYNDISKLVGVETFDCTTSNTATNITETSISPTTFQLALKGRNRSGTESNVSTANIPFHLAGTFGKSSQMAYYGAAQGYDAGTEAGTSENFSGESFRVQITDNALKGTFSGADAFGTSFALNTLGAKDLQVKPGFLVFPGGTRGYFISDPDASQDYKYYLRAFKRNSSSAAVSMVVNVGKSNLVNWGSTSNGISVGIIFESAGTDNLTRARIFDISNLTQDAVSLNVSNNNSTNPFSTAIDLYGNSTGDLTGNNYTVPLKGASNMQLDGTNQGYIVIIRYKDDIDPIEDINITIS
jgi:hypothetical protein